MSDERSVDVVDRIIEQWREQRPDLDPSAKAVTGRVIRLADEFHRRFARAWAPFGLTGAQYGVLSALRRAGEPFELTPTELAHHQMMTSGGMTPLIDSLERAGHVDRPPNPNDRRGRLVRLTSGGRTVIEDAMEVHAEVEQELVAGLAADDLADLIRVLRLLSSSVEGA